jgi:hypothetical protein
MPRHSPRTRLAWPTLATAALAIAVTAVSVGCSTHAFARHAAGTTPTRPKPARSMVVPAYTGTIVITAMKGSRPRCHAPATIRLGTWYMVRQYGNAPVNFRIPGVPGASRPVPRTATYTDSDFHATRAGIYRLVITPKPAASCQFTVR